MDNGIATRQNADSVLIVRAAFEGYYRRVQRLRVLQLIFVVTLPTILAFSAAMWRNLTPVSALAGIVMLLLDAAALYPVQAAFRADGAQTQERFECNVLALPISKARLIGAPEIEEIQDIGRATMPTIPTERLQDWYPPSLSNIPLEAARFACMRQSAAWDSDLRAWYAWILGSGGMLVVIAAIAAGLVAKLSLADALVAIALPLMPALVWTTREIWDQVAARRAGIDLRAAICGAWDEVLAHKLTVDEAFARAIQIQDALYFSRATAPGVPGFVYRLLRSRFQQRMGDSATELIRNYEESMSS